MSDLATSGISTYGLPSEVGVELIKSEHETANSSKVQITARTNTLKHKREERIHNLEKRLQMASQGHQGCLKALKVITISLGALSAIVTMGTSLAGTAAAAGALAAMQTAAATTSAIMTAVSSITEGLQDLEKALHDKKLTLSKAQGEKILAVIDETKKWVEDEKNNLDESLTRERNTLDNHKQMLADLDKSFKSMVEV